MYMVLLMKWILFISESSNKSNWKAEKVEELRRQPGCGVGSQSWWSRMFSAGVGTFVAITDSQCLLNNLNYNNNRLKMITGYW